MNGTIDPTTVRKKIKNCYELYCHKATTQKTWDKSSKTNKIPNLEVKQINSTALYP